MAFGNAGNRSPRVWSMRPWDRAELGRLRAAWEATPAAEDGPAFWAAVASAMGTNRSPLAVARRAESRQLRAKTRT